MAKLGEGDARWIVSERQDGTNVHNWHWAEKDVLPWSQSRLTELLGGLRLAEGEVGGLEASSSSEVSCEGEAVINNRKNKLIAAYELEVKGGWSGTLTEADGSKLEVNGLWKVPYLAEENADEDPEIQFSTASEGGAMQKAKAALQKSGKPAILKQVKVFVKEFAAGGPAAGGADSSTAAKQPVKTTTNTVAESSQLQKHEKKAATPSSSKSRSKFETTEKFYAGVKDIYNCFTDAKCISAYTQSPSTVNAREGGEFQMFGGSVIGKFLVLKPNELVLEWRFRNWNEADVSKVHITLDEPSQGTTVLNLTHTGIPEEDSFGNGDVLETTTSGWKQQIFHKIRAVFGYGLGL